MYHIHIVKSYKILIDSLCCRQLVVLRKEMLTQSIVGVIYFLPVIPGTKHYLVKTNLDLSFLFFTMAVKSMVVIFSYHSLHLPPKCKK